MWNYTQDIQWFYMNGILEIKQQIGKSTVCPSDIWFLEIILIGRL